MLSLIAAASYFLAIHLLVSGTRVRDAVTGQIGVARYMGFFAIASVAGLAWLINAFAQARQAPANDFSNELGSFQVPEDRGHVLAQPHAKA